MPLLLLRNERVYFTSKNISPFAKLLQCSVTVVSGAIVATKNEKKSYGDERKLCIEEEGLRPIRPARNNLTQADTVNELRAYRVPRKEHIPEHSDIGLSVY